MSTMNEVNMRPKRPATAFMLFLNAARPKIKAIRPTANVTEIGCFGGNLWRAMDNERRSQWIDHAKQLRDQYKRNMAKYLDTAAKSGVHKLKCPKRPATSFLLWLNNTRPKIKKTHAESSVIDVGRIGGQMWKALDDTKRAQWIKQAKVLQDKYKKQMAKFLARGGVKERKRRKGKKDQRVKNEKKKNAKKEKKEKKQLEDKKKALKKRGMPGLKKRANKRKQY